MSNLRQWGMVYKMYTDEFDSKLPRDYNGSPWYYPIGNYYSNNREILLCPSAKKPSGKNVTSRLLKYGGTFAAWDYFSSNPEEAAWNSIGSYGLNGWANKPEIKDMFEDMNNTDIDDKNSETGGEGFWWMDYWRKRFGLYHDFLSIDPCNAGGDTGFNFVEDIYNIPKPSRYYLTAYENRANNIPLVFDSVWLYSYFYENAGPPSKDGLLSSYLETPNATCINRHNGGINMLFMDFSTRKVGLKELWTLKWHKQFNTAGPWTKAGGVLPESWPKWMRKYKDY